MAKRLCLTFDGTWNTPDKGSDAEDEAATNAWRLHEAVAEGERQRKWYDAGVGTKWYNRVRGGAFGLGLSENIRQGYKWLIDNHEAGDEIFVFGFSRGAYTARSLVGLIRNAGLLSSDTKAKVPEAYELYRTRDEGPDTPPAVHFRRQYAKPGVDVKCLGVWDTVGALGIPLQSFEWFNRKHFEFHDTRLSAMVENAFHAVAIDEHRPDFDAALWDPPHHPDQHLEQQWFVGAHADVGGGYANRELADIPLAWMADRAASCGLDLDFDRLPQTVEDAFMGPIHDSFAEFLGGMYGRFKDRHFRPVRRTEYGNEGVEETVPRRRDTDPDYRPKNPGLESGEG